MFLTKLRIFLQTTWAYLFYLPGLILHEGSHALMAILTLSRITKIKLFPSITFSKDASSYSVIYGYVQSVAKFKAAYMFIGIAPLLLWIIPVVIAQRSGWVDLVNLHFFPERFFMLKNIWFLYVLAQISWAGYPSSQDWKVFATGLLSISGFFVVLVIYFIFSFAFNLSNISKALF